MSTDALPDRRSPVEDTSPKRKRKGLVVLLVLVLLAAIGGGAYWEYQHQQQMAAAKKAHDEQVAKAKKAAADKLHKYQHTLNAVYTEMLDDSAKAETMIGQYHQVWYDAIFNHSYTTSDDQYHILDDFSVAIQNQKTVYDNTGDNAALQSDLTAIDQYMASLQNPPSQYSDVYNRLVDVYSSVSTFIGIAQNPTGSLQSFTDQTNTLDTNITSKLNSLKILLPEDPGDGSNNT